MSLEIMIEVLKGMTESNLKLAAAIEGMSHTPVRVEPSEDTPTPAVVLPPAAAPATLPPATVGTTGASPLDGIHGVPIFVSDDQKRTWLIEELTVMNFTIPPRTRTLTLEKKYVELVKSKPEQEVDDIDPFGAAPPDVKVTLADVSTALQQYVAKAKDEKDKDVRIEKAKKILASCGAVKITDLAPENYTTVINGVRG